MAGKMDQVGDFLCIKYTLRLKRDADNACLTASNESVSQSQICAAVSSERAQSTNSDVRQVSHQPLSEMHTETSKLSATSLMPSTGTLSVIQSSKESRSFHVPSRRDAGDNCERLLRRTDEFIERIDRKYAVSTSCVSAFSTTYSKGSESVNSSFVTESTNGTSMQSTHRLGTTNVRPGSLDSKDPTSKGRSRESNVPSTPLDWMSPPSPSPKNNLAGKELLIRNASKDLNDKRKTRKAGRKENRPRRRSLSLESSADQPVATTSPALLLNLMKRSRMRKTAFQGQSHTDSSLGIAPTAMQRQSPSKYDLEGGTTQSNDLNRDDRESAKHNLSLLPSMANNEKTANQQLNDRSANKAQSKFTMSEENKKHAAKLKSELEKLSSEANCNIANRNDAARLLANIPTTERKIPIPKLERDMMRKSVHHSNGSELTMSTQTASTNDSSSNTFPTDDRTQNDNASSESTKSKSTTSTATSSTSAASSSNTGSSASCSVSRLSDMGKASCSPTDVTTAREVNYWKDVNKKP